jgi:hypothetical protein
LSWSYFLSRHAPSFSMTDQLDGGTVATHLNSDAACTSFLCMTNWPFRYNWDLREPRQWIQYDGKVTFLIPLETHLFKDKHDFCCPKST